eukprot:3407780-Rhodomonas_salina.1
MATRKGSRFLDTSREHVPYGGSTCWCMSLLDHTHTAPTELRWPWQHTHTVGIEQYIGDSTIVLRRDLSCAVTCCAIMALCCAIMALCCATMTLCCET